tara:strand:- start:613 stop:1482 length:870 start_codon:yes stop_codon:yes gene_type:complete
MTKKIKGISDIIDKYDVFILDQWGVMHDGTNGYDHAIEAVKLLKKYKKKIIIISNSSKRKISSINRLPSLGFDKNIFADVLTSGEMIWQQIFLSIDTYGKELKNCFHIYNKSKDDGLEFREGLNKIHFVEEIENADFLLACTPYDNSDPIDYIPLLKSSLEKNLLMFCANPDFETVENNEKKNMFCMGTIADLYQNMGGKVVILGKPSKEIYKEATKSLNYDLSKIIAIGDSLFHDIQGAKNFGIDSLFITSGIHKEMFLETSLSWKDILKSNKILNIAPTYICENFSI